jgi:hypothetical protein
MAMQSFFNTSRLSTHFWMAFAVLIEKRRSRWKSEIGVVSSSAEIDFSQGGHGDHGGFHGGNSP